MPMTLARAILLAAALVFSATGAAFADPLGLWRDKDGTTIRVARCGAALCGRIVSLKTRNDPETGRPWTDKHNPDAARKSRPLVGVTVFIAMRPSGPGKWSGRLYNSDDGTSLRGHLIDSGPTTLRVEGCFGALCGGEDLTRLR